MDQGLGDPGSRDDSPGAWARVRMWAGRHPILAAVGQTVVIVVLNLVYRAVADGERGTDLVWFAVTLTVVMGPIMWWTTRRAGGRQVTGRANDRGRSLHR